MKVQNDGGVALYLFGQQPTGVDSSTQNVKLGDLFGGSADERDDLAFRDVSVQFLKMKCRPK
jgi:hypothetical protein